MTKEELAELLNGRDIDNVLLPLEKKQAVKDGLIVVYGQSDDTMQFDGLITDEVGGYHHALGIIVQKKGAKLDIISEESIEEMEDWCEENQIDFNIPQVEVLGEYCPPGFDGYWKISTTIPHATFSIMEENEVQCLGLVLHQDDVMNALNNLVTK